MRTISKQSPTGSVLLVTLLFVITVAAIMVSYLMLVQNSEIQVARGQQWNSALAVAEAGVEEAMCQVNASATDLSANGWGNSGANYGPVTRPFGDGSYSVALVPYGTANGKVTRATIYSTGAVTAPITKSVITRAVKVNAENVGLFGVAMGALVGITGKGNAGFATSSWNSHDTNNIQDLNGQYNGYIGTNGDVALVQGTANLQNQDIYGDLYLGPSASFTGTPPSGTVYTDWNGKFPDVSTPTVDDQGNAIFWAAAPTTVVGSGKQAATVHDFTTSGYYIVTDSSAIVVEPGVKATILIHTASWAPASLTISGGTTNSGTIVAYQEQGAADLGSSAGAIDNRPENFIYFGLPTLTSIVWSGSSTFVGVIYAPEADISLKGGGSANNIIGAIVGKTISVNGHYDIHYDEGLVNLYSKGFVAISWDEL